MKVTLLLLFISIHNLFALEGILELKDVSNDIIEGTPLEAVIYLGPSSELENVDVRDIKLEKGIAISNISGAKVSENNADLVEINLFGIALGAVNNGEIISAKLNGKNIGIEWRAKSVLKNNRTVEQLVTIPKTWSKKEPTYWPWILLFVSIVTFYIIFSIIKKRKNIKIAEQKRLELISKWNRLFLDAKTRKDYELLYKIRNEWLMLKIVDEYQASLFFESVDKIQYSPSWSDIDLMNIENAFEIIRESFK